MYTISLVEHPASRDQILLALIDLVESRETMLLLTPKGRGEPQVNSIRSYLSKQRASMKRRKIAYVDFGIHSHVTSWTTLKGEVHDAVYLRVFRTTRHAVNTVVANSFAKDTIHG